MLFVGDDWAEDHHDVEVMDVSANNDWSKVRVWFKSLGGLGTSSYPVYGFIYGTSAARQVAAARPASELTGRNPDYVGALIDAYER